MPEYCRSCLNPKCGHRFRTYQPASKAASIRCPECGGKVDIDFAAQGAPAVAGDELHGTREVCHEVRVRPERVPAMRQLFGKAGNCFGSDGRVRFKNKTEARTFYTTEKDIKSRNVEKAAQKASA